MNQILKYCVKVLKMSKSICKFEYKDFTSIKICITQYFKIWFIQSLIFLSLKKKKKITELSLISQLANLPVIFYHKANKEI
jgi:hypothetical protein